MVGTWLSRCAAILSMLWVSTATAGEPPKPFKCDARYAESILRFQGKTILRQTPLANGKYTVFEFDPAQFYVIGLRPAKVQVTVNDALLVRVVMDLPIDQPFSDRNLFQAAVPDWGESRCVPGQGCNWTRKGGAESAFGFLQRASILRDPQNGSQVTFRCDYRE